MIRENLLNIRNRIEQASLKAGRDPSDITVVAVSKNFSADIIREGLKSGITDFGESYVQELTGKRDKLADEPIKWHFIGPLQRNKVKYLVDFVYIIHSVESIRVCEEIEKRAARIKRPITVFVEINTSGEEQKHGIRPDDASAFFRESAVLDHVQVRGLMTMAPFVDDPELARPSFRLLKDIQMRLLKQGVPEIQVGHLSMGMSNDFEVAIEEGATMVRIGSSIFGERPIR